MMGSIIIYIIGVIAMIWITNDYSKEYMTKNRWLIVSLRIGSWASFILLCIICFALFIFAPHLLKKD